MISSQQVLGLIAARGGSKGLPGKNIRDLCGKPLIAWSIDTARQSAYLDRLVVTTDSPEIADVARHYGAEVPCLRPAELATDSATSFAAIEHMIGELEKGGSSFDIVVLIEPTSPLREPGDIDKALEQMLASDADSIVSVCRAETIHPAFMFRMLPKARLESIQPQGFKVIRRQELEPVFFPEGTVYASRVKALRTYQSFYQEDTIGYEVPKWKSPEIDDMVDFLHVEAIMKHRGIVR